MFSNARGIIPGMGIRRDAFARAGVAAIAALLLTGCAQGASAPDSTEGEGSRGSGTSRAQEAVPAAPVLERLGLDIADPRAAIDALDALPVAERPAELIASVRPDALVLQPGTSEEVSAPLDPSIFYLSVAPYRDATHPCEMHSLTTCLGEMRDTEIGVRVVDATTGEVLIDGRQRTADNGFAGLWLPRDRELRVSVEAGGDTGEAVVRTGSDDPTCLTEIRLG